MGERTNEHRPGEGCYYLLCGISERDGYSVLTLAHRSGIVLARYDGSRRSEYYNCPDTVGQTVYAKLMPEESEDADYAVVNILPGDQAHCPYGDGDFAVRVKRPQPAAPNGGESNVSEPSESEPNGGTSRGAAEKSSPQGENNRGANGQGKNDGGENDRSEDDAVAAMSASATESADRSADAADVDVSDGTSADVPNAEKASAELPKKKSSTKRTAKKGAEDMQSGAKRKRNILADIPMDGKLVMPLLLLGRVEKQGAKGPYYDVTVSDKSSTVTAKDFSGFTLAVKPGEVFEATVLHNSFGYNINSQAKHVPDLSPDDFVRHPPLREEDMYEDIVDRLRVLAAEEGATVSRIGVAVYEEHRDALLRWSAAKGMHHNHRGGLLFHVYRMMGVAEGMLDVYDSLDPELLLTAVALHDIGKLTELSTDEMGTASYTVEGQLLGHLAIGEDMVAQTAARLGIEGEKLLLLRHCLAAHHGIPEYGTIVTPAILEAFVLYTLDLCDSRVFMYEQAYSALEPGTMAEKKDYGLGVAPYRPSFTAGERYLGDYTDV